MYIESIGEARQWRNCNRPILRFVHQVAENGCSLVEAAFANDVSALTWKKKVQVNLFVVLLPDHDGVGGVASAGYHAKTWSMSILLILSGKGNEADSER